MGLIDRFIYQQVQNGTWSSQASAHRIIPTVTTRQRLPKYNPDTLLSITGGSTTTHVSLNDPGSGGAVFIWNMQTPFDISAIWLD